MSNHPIHEANNDTALTSDEVQFEADEEQVMWSFRSSAVKRVWERIVTNTLNVIAECED